MFTNQQKFHRPLTDCELILKVIKYRNQKENFFSHCWKIRDKNDRMVMKINSYALECFVNGKFCFMIVEIT